MAGSKASLKPKGIKLPATRPRKDTKRVEGHRKGKEGESLAARPSVVFLSGWESSWLRLSSLIDLRWAVTAQPSREAPQSAPRQDLGWSRVRQGREKGREATFGALAAFQGIAPTTCYFTSVVALRICGTLEGGECSSQGR